MANGSNRTIGILVAVVLGLVVGWLAARSKELPPSGIPKGSFVIRVGPGACDLSQKKVRVAKADEDVLFWRTKNTKKELSIEFEVPAGILQPFEGMTHLPNGRYQVQCSGRTCFSGEINKPDPAGPTPTPGYEYKYWQVLKKQGEPDESCDGHVIVEW